MTERGHDKRYAIGQSENYTKSLGGKSVYGFTIGINKTVNWYLNSF